MASLLMSINNFHSTQKTSLETFPTLKTSLSYLITLPNKLSKTIYKIHKNSKIGLTIFSFILLMNFKKYGVNNATQSITDFIESFVENFIHKMPFLISWIAELKTKRPNYLTFDIFIDFCRGCKILVISFTSKRKTKIKNSEQVISLYYFF